MRRHPQRGLARARPGRDRAGCDRRARRRRRRRRISPRRRSASRVPTGRRTSSACAASSRRARPRDEPEIVNDAIGGLRCGSDELVGVSVVIGTCAAVAGRNADGKLFHLGFWPDSTERSRSAPMALAAVWRHMLGLGPDTSLSIVRSSAGAARMRRSSSTRSRGSAASTSRSPAASPTPSSTKAEAGDRRRDLDRRDRRGRMGDYAKVRDRTGQLGAPFPLVSAAVSSGTRRRSSVTSSIRASRTVGRSTRMSIPSPGPC